MTAIRAILFDYGGVYVDSPFSAIADVAVDMQLDPDLLKQITFGDMHMDNDHPWHRLERGEISLEEAREGILLEGKKHDLETDIYVMLARFANVKKSLCQEIVDKTLEWKSRDYKLAMVTNNLKEFSGWRDTLGFDVEEIYDVIVDSCNIGMRKPDPAVFEHTLKQLDVKPEEALFIDDHEPNVLAARSVGIDSFVVKDPIGDTIDWVESKLSR